MFVATVFFWENGSISLFDVYNASNITITRITSITSKSIRLVQTLNSQNIFFKNCIFVASAVSASSNSGIFFVADSDTVTLEEVVVYGGANTIFVGSSLSMFFQQFFSKSCF